jgi:hypothetical protein
MTLLELTQKEVDFLKEVIALEKESVSKSSSRFTEKQRKTDICDSFLAKVELASQPKSDLPITSDDLFLIVSSAKQKFIGLPSDLYISNKKIEESDFKHIALANAVIMWLNNKDLLKRLVGFDYTDKSYQYETTEE